MPKRKRRKLRRGPPPVFRRLTAKQRQRAEDVFQAAMGRGVPKRITPKPKPPRKPSPPPKPPEPVEVQEVGAWEPSEQKMARAFKGFEGLSPDQWSEEAFGPGAADRTAFNADLQYFDAEALTEDQLALDGKKIGSYLTNRVYIYVVIKVPAFAAPRIVKGYMRSPSKERDAAMARLKAEGARGSRYAIKAYPVTFGQDYVTLAEAQERLHRRTSSGRVLWKEIIDVWAEAEGIKGVEACELLGWTKGEGWILHERGR